MFPAVEDSVEYFFKDILKLKLEKVEEISGELYGSAIPLHSKEGDYDFYLFFSKGIFDEFLKVFFKNSNFKEDDFCDLAKECANEIIGYTKTKIASKEDGYKLGIPEYLGRIDFSNFKLDRSLSYQINGHNFKIGYKKT